MDAKRKTITWIWIFLALAALALGGVFAARRFSEPAVTARITLDGELYREIDLRAVTMPYEFTIETELGSNTVRVEHGRIAVITADCPDKICVQRGWAEDGLLPIVCLPHRLVIQLEDGT
jgi:hypothetical protein